MRHVPSSKVRIPDAAHPVLSRPRLLAVLDGGPGALTVVVAPAGFGKTVLLAQWARARPELPTAWVTLDEDDTGELIWPVVCAALAAVPELEQGVGHVARAWLAGDRGPGDDVQFVDELLDAAAAAPARLVLDGVEHLTPGACRGLAALARDFRTGIDLVLAGRTDPEIPLARLRLEGRLRELRADDLRFTDDEVPALLHLLGVTLDASRSEELGRRTGGWGAGLRLAARRLRDHDDPGGFLDAFPGGDGAVADYLVVEILDRLRVDERDVLRQVSIVDFLPAPLAPVLCDREDAADVLDRIARRSGLLTVYDGPGVTYRTHELLRSHLSGELERRGRDRIRALHSRAADWFDGHGRPGDALRHAEAAGDVDLLRGLLERRAAELATAGDHALLLRAARVHEGPVDPRVLLGTALADLGRGSARITVRTLRQVRRARVTAAEPDLRIYRDAVERLCGVSRPLPVGDPVPADPVLAALSRAGTAAATLRCGDVEAALDLARVNGLTFLEVQCRCLLGLAHWTAGDLRRAGLHAADGIAAATAGGWGSSPWAVAARAVLAHVAVLRGQPDRALTVASEGLLAAAGPVPEFALRSARGAALVDLKRVVAGVEEMRRARVEATGVALAAPVVAAAALIEHETALRLGHKPIAAAALGTLATAAPAEYALARARAELASGRPASARTVVRPLLAGTGEVPVLPATLVEAWVLEANAADATGNRIRTRTALHTAAELAEPLDAIRPLLSLDEGPDAALVDLLGAPGRTSSFAACALAARTPRDPLVTGGLSRREQEVLLRLQSPGSLDEIARALGVSVNTVKTHLRAIYVKLGVAGRRAAVVAAHHHGLLS